MAIIIYKLLIADKDDGPSKLDFLNSQEPVNLASHAHQYSP